MDLSKIGEGFKKDLGNLKKQNEEDMYAHLRGDDSYDEETGSPMNQAEASDDVSSFIPRRQMTDEELKEEQESIYNISGEDSPLFPGGPLQSEIDSWKKMYEENGNKVLITEVDEDVFIFRTLNRFEYKQVIAIPNTNPLQREEIFCQTCVLWPLYDWSVMASGKAGLPSTLSQIIMENSGFTKNYAVQVL